MGWETKGTSESDHSKGSNIGGGGRGPSDGQVVSPIVGPSESKPVKRTSDGPPLLKQASNPPSPAKKPLDSSGPGRRLSAWEVDLIGLIGSKEVPALLIPSDDRRPVTKTEFDLDKLWRYDAVGYDKNRVFLTKKHAYLDHRKNSLATDWVQHHSDAAKDPDSDLPSPEKLYGPVYVVAIDPVMEWITRSTTQLDKLKRALGWIAPLRPTE